MPFSTARYHVKWDLFSPRLRQPPLMEPWQETRRPRRLRLELIANWMSRRTYQLRIPIKRFVSSEVVNSK